MSYRTVTEHTASGPCDACHRVQARSRGGRWCWTLKRAQRRSRAERWSWAQKDGQPFSASVVPQQLCYDGYCPCDSICSAQRLKQQLRSTRIATQWGGPHRIKIVVVLSWNARTSHSHSPPPSPVSNKPSRFRGHRATCLLTLLITDLDRLSRPAQRGLSAASTINHFTAMLAAALVNAASLGKLTLTNKSVKFRTIKAFFCFFFLLFSLLFFAPFA